MATSDQFGRTLVTGGCGFVGFHIVAALLKEPDCGPITVISRNPTSNLHDGVEYRACDLTDADAVEKVVREVQPRIVFHTASPLSSSQTTTIQEYLDVNVGGTANLLSALRQSSSVQALVYTSSNSVFAGCPHDYLDETQPTNASLGGKCTGYEYSKTLTERSVLAANGKGFKTTALRICAVYGERDSQTCPGFMKGVADGQTKVQLGDNTNLLDVTWAGNAAEAHILAGRALLVPDRAKGRVDGEAFNITDGHPVPFWDYARMFYRAAGDTTDRSQIKVIPAWLALKMAAATEWAFWLGTLGTVSPTSFNELLVTHCVYNFTYDISKAKRVLGYDPVSHLEEEIPKSVAFELKRRESTRPSE